MTSIPRAETLEDEVENSHGNDDLDDLAPPTRGKNDHRIMRMVVLVMVQRWW